MSNPGNGSNSNAGRRSASSSGAGGGSALTNGRAGRPSPGPASSSASWTTTRRATTAAAGGSNSNGSSNGGGARMAEGGNSKNNKENTLHIPLAIPASTLLRLGVLTGAAADHLSSATPASTSALNGSSSSSGEITAEELQALQEDLHKIRDAADARVRELPKRRERLIASSSSSSASISRPPLPHSASSTTSLRSSSKVSPTIPTSSKLASATNKHATPLNASTLGTNNAINNVPSRGVKRGRAPDSASDSSLSPQSVTSISSFEPTASQNAARPSSSRHTSPAVSTSTVGSTSGAAGSGLGLGLSSAKLSRTASSSKDKEGSVPPSSTAASTKDVGATSKPLAIPGMGAPMPALPGFTKKKKQEKQASPAPSSRHMSPTIEQAPRASTSSLPPPPSSLPPRPASLPAKPATSYGASQATASSSTSSSARRRETSATGSTTSNRDKDRDRERERNSNNQRDKEREKRDAKGPGRERSISKGKESDRDSNYSASGSTSMTPRDDYDSKYASTSSSNKLDTVKNEDSHLSQGRGTSPNALQPPEPSPRPPEDEPPPPPPLPSQDSTSDEEVAKNGDGALSAPIIAVEDATPTPEPDSAMQEDIIVKKEAPASRAATPSAGGSSEVPVSKDSSAPQQGRGRKTLPPTSTVKAGSATPEPSPKASSAAAPPSAIPANVSGTPTRPSTPLGRKKLPASVTAAASRRASPAPAHDGTPVSTVGHPAGLDARPSSAASTTGTAAAGHTPAQEGGKTSAGNADALAAMEAKQKRKEEKRKRKLAALTNGTSTPSGSPKPNGHALLNGASPAIKINGVSPSSLRNDAHPPTKMRRVDSATSIDSTDKGGLKVKLNGITLNRSTSPGENAQPPVKKGPSIPGVADDFALPTRSLVPPPPAIHLPAPTPSKQSEINENFDNAKPSTQVPYTTFANWVNDFFRSFGEDDLAFLAPKPEDPGVYDIPPLGPHYQDTWAVMDAELAGEQVDPPPPSNALIPPALRRFKSQNLTTAALPTENMYLGPLGERLISAFKDTKDIRGIMDDLFAAQNELQSDKANLQTNMAVDAANLAVGQATGAGQTQKETFDTQTSPQLLAPSMFNDPNVLSTMPSIKDMDALDFESRLTRELSFLGVIPLPTRLAPPPATKPSKKTAESNTTQFDLSSSVDWSSRADDEISTALRACQRQLKKQVALNDKRKERLASIVRQRIAYQEYEHLRDGLEAVIEAAWAKRQRAAQRKAQKDRKEKDKKGDREKDRDKLEAASLAQSIAALNTPQPLSASLVAALTKRRNLVDSVQPLFPPNAYILPTESIFQGLDETVAKDV